MSKLAMAVVVAIGGGLCSSCNTTTPKIVFKHSETRGRLQKNGLRFVVMPDPTTQLVEVDVRYEVGSREDPPGKAGLAHLVEHLTFQQKPDGPDTKPLIQVLQQVTLNMNAYTTWDKTHFMVNASAKLLDALVKVEAMRMYYGCQTISEDEFLREREVVRNELRGRNRSAEALIPQLTLSAIYPKGHAYAQMVGGDDQQLSSISLADACEFMKQYYVPERATLIIAGGIIAEDVIRSIEHWFNVLDKRTPAPRRVVAPFTVTNQRQTFELDLERPWVTVAWALPDARTPEGEATQFAIGNAFFDAARNADKYECATQGFPEILGGREAPIFLIALELSSLSKLDECLDFVWKAAQNAGHGWDGGLWVQLEEFKNRRKAAFISSLEPLFGEGGRTDQVGDLVQFSRDVDFDSREIYVFHELDKIGKFELASVGSALKRALDPSRAGVTVFKPNKEGIKGDRRSEVTFQARSHETMEMPEVDLSEARRPLQVPAGLRVGSEATRFELGNGMHIVLLPVDAMPVVAAELIFNVGDATTPDNPALAATAAEFLSLPPDATVLRDTGVQMRCNTTPDHTICRAQGMSIYLDVVVKAFERLIKVGGYSQLRIERWQKATETTYKLRRPRQQLAFQRQQLAAIYGPEHPYTRTGVLVPQLVGKIGRDELDSFRNEHYTAANATLVIAGAFDVRQAEALIRNTFGSWPKGHKDAPVPSAPYQRTGPAYLGVIGDEDPQVDVAILYPSPAGISGQQAARMVLTEMLNNQLWGIRARLGATYGTYARRDDHLGASAYHLGGAVDAPRAGEAIRAIRDGIDALRNGTEFDAAFVRARRKVIQKLLGESTVSTELASQLGQIARFGLDPNYDSTLLRQTAALSTAQVKDLLARELDPKNEVVVTLGSRAAVTQAFANAGIKDARFVEPDYK
ncbi:MAG TPA: insulinase family protein [Kofleriaceae bacterium]|nr:insulinase family protein [Kofleriaceae bacterium]